MKDLGMSTQQKPLPQGVPASSPQPMLRGLPSQQLTEQQGALSTTRAWDKAGNPEGGCSEAKWAVRPHYTRHNDHTTPDTMGRHPDRGIHGAHNAPHRSLTDKSGTKHIHINEETKALKTRHSLKRANRLRGQRALLYVPASQHRPQLFFVFSTISTSSMSFLKHASDESRNSANCTYNTHIIKSVIIETTILNHIFLRRRIR